MVHTPTMAQTRAHIRHRDLECCAALECLAAPPRPAESLVRAAHPRHRAYLGVLATLPRFSDKDRADPGHRRPDLLLQRGLRHSKREPRLGLSHVDRGHPRTGRSLEYGG